MNKIIHLFKFDLSNVSGDLSGGLTAAIISLPMGLAFGVQAQMGAEAGIYTAIILAIVSAFIGGTQTLISDPTGPMTVVAATVVTTAVATYSGNLGEALPLIIATFVLAGAIQVLFSFLKIAKYVKFMPYPVISGFMSGIGVIIILLQLYPLLGHSSPKGMIEITTSLHHPISNLNPWSLGLGILTIALIYVIPLFSKKLPSILIALIVTTVLSVLIDHEVPVIGEIPTGLPDFQLMRIFDLHWSDISLIIGPAITLAALGVIDTLLTSVVADNLTKTRHNGNRELMGQGLGNLVTALFGGIPGAGATMGTVTNINSGAKTRLSGMSKGVFLLIIIIGFGTYVQFIPQSVLAGILVTIGIGIIDFRGLKILFKVPKSDSFILLTVLLITVFDNLLDAVGAGMVLASVIFMQRMSKSVESSNVTGELNELSDFKLPESIACRVYLKRLDGPLFFGFTDRFKTHSESIAAKYDVVIIDLTKVPFLDESGILTLEEVIRMFESKETEVLLVGAKEEIIDQLIKLNIIPGLIPKKECFNEMANCVKYVEKELLEENGANGQTPVFATS